MAVGRRRRAGRSTSLRLRSFGEKTSTRNSATNGNDGRRLRREDAVRRQLDRDDLRDDAEQQAAEERHGMLESAASTAAEIAATTSGV